MGWESILHREFLSGNHCNQQQKQQFLKKTWGTHGMSLSIRQKTKSDSEENNLFKKSPDCREFSSANNAWNLFFANCTCSELHSLHFLFSWHFKHENANEIYMIAEQVILALLRNPHNRYGFEKIDTSFNTSKTQITPCVHISAIFFRPRNNRISLCASISLSICILQVQAGSCSYSAEAIDR